ncbi:MYG1 family protein [Teichococcus aestuarii]
MSEPRLRLVTHSGKFHCDEVFAYGVLRRRWGWARRARTTR